jgi:hypothetical protein
MPTLSFVMWVDADLVFESLDEAEGDLVLGSAIGGRPVPMMLDH